jgi:proline dehydrogenase
MARLTDQQWHDAFRAANYSDADAQRFIARLKEKIDDAFSLRARPVEQATR